MVTIKLDAILENGELKFTLPDKLPDEDFELHLQVQHQDDDIISEEEARQLMTPNPKNWRGDCGENYENGQGGAG